MFDLGNGVWIAPEFVASLIMKVDKWSPDQPAYEWVEITMSSGRETYSLPFDDEKIGDPPRKGLKTLGYTSCQHFCDELLAAIQKAKHP